MTRFNDLTGRKFGRLTAIKLLPKTQKHSHWLCQCECGATKGVRGQHLTAGLINSCGCLRREITSQRLTTHGMHHTKIYQSWCKMRSRCENQNNNRYDRYGGRGISICERWSIFQNFLDDMGITWVDGATIERRDNNGNYDLSNCLWIPRNEQAKNRSTSIFIDTSNGKITPLEAAERLGIKPSSMYERLKKWPKDRWLEPSKIQSGESER